MANLKYYNEATSEWETLVIGKQGPSGIANATAPVTYDGGTQTVGLTDAFVGQTVRSYADASARATAIPSPVEGMVTYLEDIDDLRTYSNGAWVSPYGMTLVANLAITNSAAATLDNVFTSAYDNYRVVFNYTQNTSGGLLYFQLRAGGANISTSTYRYQGVRSFGSTIDSTNQTAVTAFDIGSADLAAGQTSFVKADIYSPALATRTYLQYAGFAFQPSVPFQLSVQTVGMENTAAVRDGINFGPGAGTMTGRLRIYGWRNS